MDNFLAYRSLYYVLTYTIAVAAMFFVFNRGRTREDPPLLLKICALISVGFAALIPLVFRLLPPATPFLVWECDVAQQLFSSRQNGLGLLDFATDALKRNSGLVSSSAWSLFYGIPSYAALGTFGWSGLSLRIAGYIAGLLSLLVGACIVRRLFNASVAYLFVIILATNPLFVVYMGLGIALTGTMLGVLLALFAVLRTLQSTGWALVGNGIFASMALVAGTLNYGPGRLTILAVVAFTLLFGFSCLLRRPRNVRTGMMAIIICLSAIAMIIQTNRSRIDAAFLDARGEQAFIMMQHHDMVREYLGDTPELRALENQPLTTWLKLKFLSAVVKTRINEFSHYISPLKGIDVYYLRGSGSVDTFRAFQSALSIPCLIGLCLCISSWRSFRSILLLTIFAGSLGPLFLTNRIDNYRFFLLLIPISIWASDGLWRIIQRFRGTLFGELHCGAVIIALTSAMSGHLWFYTARPDTIDSGATRVIQTIESRMQVGSRVAVASNFLSCPTQAEIDFSFARLAEGHDSETFVVLPARLSMCLSASQLYSDPKCHQEVLAELTRGPIIVVTGVDLGDLEKMLLSFGNKGSVEQIGAFKVLTIYP